MANKLAKSYFEVLGLCCSSEVPLVEKILKPLRGVNDVSVIVTAKTVIVVHDQLLVSQSQLAEALNKEKLEASIKLQGQMNSQKKLPEIWVMASGILLGVSLFKYFYQPMQFFAIGSVVLGLPPLIMKSLAAIRNCAPNVNVLMLIAVVGTLALQDYVEAGSIVFLYAISQWLESRASHKAMAVMSSLTSMAPKMATLAETGKQIDVNKVSLCTVLAVKAGEAIPIDGIIVEGQCEVDEKMLTGESLPGSKQVEDNVWAGTINLNGYIKVKTTALAEDCVVARMTKLVEKAHKKKSRAERLIDTCAKYYIPAVMLASAGFAIVPAALRLPNRDHWFHLALVVMVSACPCALILCTPVAIFCALSKAAMSGILVKGGEYVELLAKVKTMAFDKTGTITRGEFVVTNFKSLSQDISFNTLLYWVSSIESKSSHPMAAALIDYSNLHAIEPISENVEDFQNFPGEGVSGKIDGKEIYIGNHRMAKRAGCSAPALGDHIMEGKTSGFIFCGPSAIGVFNLSDVCRSGAKEAIVELKSLGIKTLMLTGDSPTAAKVIQDQLDMALDEIMAEQLPEDKAKIIEGLKKHDVVAMVGDGMNDAPALATADIGISMGISGSALATETGHIILMSNDLKKLPEAVKLARKTQRKLIENIIISVSVKGAILVLAFMGHPLVWAAVLADVGTCLVVILNSMLLLQGTTRNQEEGSAKSTFISNDKIGRSTNDCQTPLLDNSYTSSSEPMKNENRVYSSSSQVATLEQNEKTKTCGCCKSLKGASDSKQDNIGAESDGSLNEIIIR